VLLDFADIPQSVDWSNSSMFEIQNFSIFSIDIRGCRLLVSQSGVVWREHVSIHIFLPYDGE